MVMLPSLKPTAPADPIIAYLEVVYDGPHQLTSPHTDATLMMDPLFCANLGGLEMARPRGWTRRASKVFKHADSEFQSKREALSSIISFLLVIFIGVRLMHIWIGKSKQNR